MPPLTFFHDTKPVRQIPPGVPRSFRPLLPPPPVLFFFFFPFSFFGLAFRCVSFYHPASAPFPSCSWNLSLLLGGEQLAPPSSLRPLRARWQLGLPAILTGPSRNLFRVYVNSSPIRPPGLWTRRDSLFWFLVLSLLRFSPASL